MNERIKELALLSGQNLIPFMDPRVKDMIFERFAELIVQECVESLWTEECYTSDLALKEFLKNSKKINLHFGVEE